MVDGLLFLAKEAAYEFRNGKFLDSMFSERKNLARTLKVLGSNNINFVSTSYFRSSGTMTLSAVKENIRTGEKVNTYYGFLSIDKEDAIFYSHINYDCQILYNEHTQSFNLLGRKEG